MLQYLILILVVTLIYFLYRYVNRNLDYWKNQNVRGPKPVPIFGNLKESALRQKHQGEIFKEIYNEFKNEKVVGVYRMTTPCLFIRDPDIIKHIMIKDFDAFVDRGIEFDTEGLGKNLFHADGDTWQVLRNKLTPLFTTGKLKNMMYLMLERGDKFMKYVDKVCRENPEQEVHKLIQKYTISTIGACAFGLDINIDDETMDELMKINKIMFTLNYANELDMMFPGVLKTFSSSLFPKQVKNFFYKLTRTVISERKGLPSNRKDFMDLMLEMREQKEIEGMNRTKDKLINIEITEGVITAQAFVFYVAGFETSATTMAFMLYELTKNPEVQDKLIAEIDEVLANSKGEITYDCLMEMKYLTQVFDETLRLYPIVEPLQRNANRKYHVPGTNVVLNKGQTVLISPAALQQDKKYFPNPEKFDPERFSPENSGNRHPCVYIPFGIGPRNCIGMRFAKVQSRICLAKLLSKYRVERSKATQEIMVFEPNNPIFNPKGGIYLKLIPRNN